MPRYLFKPNGSKRARLLCPKTEDGVFQSIAHVMKISSWNTIEMTSRKAGVHAVWNRGEFVGRLIEIEPQHKKRKK